ncbi:DUF4358 domain-containing protein [bacterium D16-51]|nr:DUF4358 domain-containing protein [bacterium D16-59]RKI56609.1 DUF4358 domain-containing protein [bacterium D16-51]
MAERKEQGKKGFGNILRKKETKEGKEQAGTGSKIVKQGRKGWAAVTKPDFHTLCIAFMGVFVIFVMAWGTCQSIKSINASAGTEGQTVLKVEDNSKNEGKPIDVDVLIQKILDNVAFEAELNKLDDSVAEGMVEMAEGTKLQIYMGSGTFADELLVMTSRDEASAKKNMEHVNAHLKETEATFRDYLPEEAKKVGDAVSIRCGCYVIVCITSDYETAEKIINSVIKE